MHYHMMPLLVWKLRVRRHATLAPHVFTITCSSLPAAVLQCYVNNAKVRARPSCFVFCVCAFKFLLVIKRSALTKFRFTRRLQQYLIIPIIYVCVCIYIYTFCFIFLFVLFFHCSYLFSNS